MVLAGVVDRRRIESRHEGGGCVISLKAYHHDVKEGCRTIGGMTTTLDGSRAPQVPGSVQTTCTLHRSSALYIATISHLCTDTQIYINTEVSVELTEYAQTDDATDIYCATLANDMEPWKPDFELLRRAQEDTPGGDADMEFFRHIFGLSRPDPGRRRFRISKARIDSYKQRRAPVEVDVQSLQALEAAVRQLEQTVAALVSAEVKRSTDGYGDASGGGA
jgi:hypothetical protein